MSSRDTGMDPWKILDSRYLLRRWWMNLRQDRVALPGGGVIDEYHVLEYPDWGCAVALTPAEEVVLVRQYRHGIEGSHLELPGGALDAGEEPLVGVQREFVEETGYAADAWTPLGRCAPDPSRHTNFAYLYVATGARRVREPALDATEDIRVELVPAHALGTVIAEEGIVHGIHLLALFWAMQQGHLQTTMPAASQ